MSDELCRHRLAEIRRVLTEAGLPTALRDDGLVVFHPTAVAALQTESLGLFMHVACSDDHVALLCFIKNSGAALAQLGPEQREAVLRGLLSINTALKMSVGLDNDNDVAIDVWNVRLASLRATGEELGRLVLANIVVLEKILSWLSDSLNAVKQGREPAPFSLESLSS